MPTNYFQSKHEIVEYGITTLVEIAVV